MSNYPFVVFLVIPLEYSKVVIGFPSFMRDFGENRVIHIINTQEDGIEVITMFEAGYPYVNIHKYHCRQ